MTEDQEEAFRKQVRAGIPIEEEQPAHYTRFAEHVACSIGLCPKGWVKTEPELKAFLSGVICSYMADPGYVYDWTIFVDSMTYAHVAVKFSAEDHFVYFPVEIGAQD